MTGGAISKPQILAMWEEIKENDRKLTECLGPHDFQSTVDKRVFECAKCGGTIRISEKNWYEKGLEHGKA